MHLYIYPHTDIGVKNPGRTARGSVTRSAEVLFAEHAVKGVKKTSNFWRERWEKEKKLNFLQLLALLNFSQGTGFL